MRTTALLLLAVCTASAQSERFLQVKSWTGTFTMTTPLQQGEGQDSNKNKVTWRLESNARGTVQIDQLENANDYAYTWQGSGTGSLFVNHLVAWVMNFADPCTNTFTSQGTYSTALDSGGSPVVSRIFLRRAENTYDFGFLSSSTKVVRNTKGVCFKVPVDETRSNAEPFFFAATKIPLPDSGLTLSGSRKLKPGKSNNWPLLYTGTQIKMDYDAEISWTLAPALEEAELVVDPQSYDTWRPQAGASETTPGNGIEIRARLRTKDDKTPAVKATKFRFELVSVSKEPGISMNMPEPGKALGLLDMKFDEQPPLVIGNQGQTAETAGPESSEASATVTSYDWGGYATLKVTADLTDGRRLTGYLKGEPATTDIPLPKRAKNSLIADKWKRDRGVSGLADNDDSENDPVGDGHQGDGLTLYEEYRGFHEAGVHIEGNPRKKDYFILDQAKGLYKAGIALYAQVTGLEVHHKFRSAEIAPSRVVNFNLGGGPHRVDQHAVIVAISSALAGAAETLGGPGLPREIRKINMPLVRPGFRGFKVVGDLPPVSYLSAALAHELLHASNVYHHGEENKDIGKVRWTAGGDDGPVLENGVPIRVLTEDLIEMRPPLLPLPLTIYIGGNQGTNSGVEDCLMRYDTSQAYIARSDKALRYFIYFEKAGYGLCDSPQGTGVNDKDHLPQSRYGDADVSRKREGCKRQICVNDAMSHTPR